MENELRAISQHNENSNESSLSTHYETTSNKKNKASIHPALIALLLIFTLLPIFSHGCEVKFSTVGERKEKYKAGEEVIIEVTVVYTHRNCEIQLSDTKFTYEGMKILGATPWKEKSPNTFARQIKIVLTSDALPEAKLTIIRKCSKDGALGSYKLAKTA